MGLHQLVNREYWKRLWIVQEVVMGGVCVWVKWGVLTIEWERFCRGMAVLHEHL
jgi:hypothetical protein